jgi:hypothetical protein
LRRALTIEAGFQLPDPVFLSGLADWRAQRRWPVEVAMPKRETLVSIPANWC